MRLTIQYHFMIDLQSYGAYISHIFLNVLNVNFMTHKHIFFTIKTP